MNRRRWLFLAVTLALGAFGGFLASLLGLPAAWITGSMVVVTIATLAGFDTRLPLSLLEVAFVIIGISLGAGVTPELVQGLGSWPISLIGLGITVIGCIYGVQTFLVRVAGWDRDTAFFSAVPGALSYVIAVASMTRADIRQVAVSQSVRVFLLVALLPSLIAAVEPVQSVAPAIAYAGPAEIAIMLVAAVATGFLFWRLKVPAPMLTGGLASSAVLHGTGLVVGTLPYPVVTSVFVVLGVLIGSRFRGATVAFLRNIGLASLGAFFVATGIAGALAFLVSVVTGEPLDQILVAFAPGGLEAMTSLALALSMDTAFVAAHQLARFAMIALILPFLARDALRRGRQPEDGGS